MLLETSFKLYCCCCFCCEREKSTKWQWDEIELLSRCLGLYLLCLPTLLRYRYVGRQLYKARSPGWRNCFHTWRISLKNKQTKRICAKHILMIAVNMSCQLKRKRAWALGAGRDQMCKGSWGQWHNFHSKQKVGQKCKSGLNKLGFWNQRLDGRSCARCKLNLVHKYFNLIERTFNPV